MRLTAEDARLRLAESVHGVLCTLHPDRGPDPIPVVYAVTHDGYVGVPVDSVKSKSTSRLRREDNLAGDPRAALLVEHWDGNDWSRLWWVRAHLEFVTDPSHAVVEDLTGRLSRAVPQYLDKPFHRVLVCRVVALTGWAANAGS